MHNFAKTALLTAVIVGLNGCGGNSENEESKTTAENGIVTVDLLSNRIQNNASAYVSPQCYTKTKDSQNRVHNPCFSCHTQGVEPNYLDDSEFQLAYDFREYSRTNRYTNLFKDRTEAIAKINDEAMLNYLRTSNYIAEDDSISLSQTLQNVPNNWDFNQNGQWDGFVPDIYFNFDNEGFDQTPSGKDTGWRTFGYAPFLGTFWPTNGSTDDVIIRLAEPFRKDDQGNYSRAVYKLNLAIVESMIRQKNIAIDPTNENLYQLDLNANGVLDVANEIVFDWDPTKGKQMYYVGQARTLQQEGSLHLAAGLYPEGTEFVHTVRYLDINESGKIQLSPRIKELRYSQKTHWNNYSQLYNVVAAETAEARQFPDRLRNIVGNPEEGLSNGQGWVYQGFIEDQNGALRPQTFEESMTCVGCHSGVGVTTDSSFAFPRKLGHDSFQKGWYHWTQKGLQGIAEPQWQDGTYEYTKYLTENHSGNEFRSNDEVQEKFFNADGSLNQDAIELMHNDIAELIIPSPERAMELNKAYKVIVEEQSYIYGRDPHVKPLDNVWDVVPEGEETGITKAVISQPIK